MIDGKRILVTGGLGFIGSNLVDFLVSENADVTIIDNFSTGRQWNLSNTSNSVIRGDFSDQKILEKILPSIDIIFHQAARLEIFESIADPMGEIDENVVKTVKLLEMARKYDVDNFIFASSACVYGEPKKIPQKEHDEIRPQWPYGVSKLLGCGIPV